MPLAWAATFFLGFCSSSAFCVGLAAFAFGAFAGFIDATRSRCLCGLMTWCGPDRHAAVKVAGMPVAMLLALKGMWNSLVKFHLAKFRGHYLFHENWGLETHTCLASQVLPQCGRTSRGAFAICITLAGKRKYFMGWCAGWIVVTKLQDTLNMLCSTTASSRRGFPWRLYPRY